MLALKKKRDLREYARRNPSRVNTNYHIAADPKIIERNKEAFIEALGKPFFGYAT
jgi:hypothetical protein